MLKVLVAEDNADLRQLMKIHLNRAGYMVLEAGDGLEALDILAEKQVHLLIVDVMMPNMDGCELTASLRSANIDIPVLMLTAKGTLEDKRAGFLAGSDDYLVKPVDMDEMLLHVGALLRRSHISQEKEMVIGATILNEDRLSVSCDGQEIFLRRKEFQLLFLLLSYSGRIFTRQMLMDEIWGYDSETDQRTVDVHVKRLREKFNENKDFSIQTVRGLGYKAVTK
ncbi:MAG: response regulator transcription factor [Bacillota bacterium]|nr:response regulator transcription factor [Bacillota bacterium]